MIKNLANNQDLQIFTISELSQMTADVLKECFSDIWITGEISNLAIPASGHAYLTLKDEKAQLRTVIFKGVYAKVRQLQNGMMVTVWGQMNLYTPRGELQIVARQVMTEGDGPLAIRFEQLKQFCAKQGWFSAEHKQALPKTIRTIGVVTSATGAALFDVLKVLYRRNPNIEVIVYPSQVQGELAPAQLVQALSIAQSHAVVDVILLTRGGGSAEDLFCFNDVEVVKAIYHCTIPVVSAIGHEVDTTLADWAADVRAATPSAGAEILSDDLSQLKLLLAKHQQYCTQLIKQKLNRYQHQLQLLKQSCLSPIIKIKQQQQQLQLLGDRLTQLMQHKMKMRQLQLQHCKQTLQALNPHSILERGYAMIKDDKTNQVITDANQLTTNQTVQIDFAKSTAKARVLCK